MQSSRIRDLVVGLFVLAGLAAIAYLSLQVGGLSYKGPGGLELVASFDAVGGLSERAPVRIAGVKVGQVESIVLGDDLCGHVDEAADILGIPRGTVLSRLHRGRQRLKAILEREPDFPVTVTRPHSGPLAGHEP